jgi:hypothetical protein
MGTEIEQRWLERRIGQMVDRADDGWVAQY